MPNFVQSTSQSTRTHTRLDFVNYFVCEAGQKWFLFALLEIFATAILGVCLCLFMNLREINLNPKLKYLFFLWFGKWEKARYISYVFMYHINENDQEQKTLLCPIGSLNMAFPLFACSHCVLGFQQIFTDIIVTKKHEFVSKRMQTINYVGKNK